MLLKMDGDKYNKHTIDYIKTLSNLDNSEKNLNHKRRTCVLVNGQSKNMNNSFKWNRSPSSGDEDIVFKPMWVHSAAAIFIMIKYPHIRNNDSFVITIINSNLTEECLKIALDVLTEDEDCHDFIATSDIGFNSGKNLIITDETNGKIIYK